MSSAIVLPVAKAFYLCDGTIGFPGGKTDLIGIFNSIKPAGYPHVQKHFVVYARLGQGLGAVPFFIDIRLASTQKLVHVTNVHTLHFPNRDRIVEMALTMKNTPFPGPGLYLVELFCDNQWVADTTVLLK